MGYPGIRVDESKLAWDPAEVTVPAAPPVTPGGDPLSVLVAAVVPDYESDVKRQVAATRAREERFAANLQAARGSYHGTDGAGGDQISSAGSKLSDPADAFGAGVPASAAPAAASSAGEGGTSLLSQLMGVAMQVGQQAVQVPMQAAGAAGQMVQPVMQGVQGIVQQASQSEKPGDGAKGDAAANGAQGAGAGLPGSSGDKPEDKDQKDEEKSSEQASLEDKDKEAAGADAGRGPQAPVGAPRTEASIPGDAPRHRRMTETSPEVAL